MNIRIIRKALVAAIFVIGSSVLTSCGSVSKLVNDPYFQEGFRQGWNSTAPEEYRY